MSTENNKTFNEAWRELAGAVNEITEQLAESVENTKERLALAMICCMHRFYLVRHVDMDPDKISGTGIVAEGVVYEDGTVAMRWKTKHKSTALYDSMDELLAIHGHGGKTVVKYIDA